MGEHTAISWTDHTMNPWIGCARVSLGCQRCYAEALTKRTGMAEWGVNGTRMRTSTAYWRQPLKWDRAAAAAGRPALVFCASLADVFEDRPDLVQPRADLFDLIAATPHLIWQLLTKRPENVERLSPLKWWSGERGDWPANVWIGTTVEDQQRADERIPLLLNIPAPVRFLSCEPMLGPVVLRADWLGPNASVCQVQRPTSAESARAISAILRAVGRRLGGRYVDWVIVGGESGPGHRPLVLDDARALVGQLQAAGVPTWFKQVGGRTPTAGGDTLDGRTYHEFPPDAQR